MGNITRKASIVMTVVLSAACLMLLSFLVSAKYVKNVDGAPKDVVVLSTQKTTLFSDGALIFNEQLENRASDISTHGDVVKSYPPLNEQNPYVWENASQVPWAAEAAQVKSVAFGVEGFKPTTSTAYWFSGMNNTEFTTIDLRSLDTFAVTNMIGMFDGCTNLKEIKASESFVTSALVPSTQKMFNGCNSLEGGAHTKYIDQDESVRDDSTFACIDGGATLKGYFTGDEPPVLRTLYYGISEDNTLHIADHSVGVATNENPEALAATAPTDCHWNSVRSTIKKVEFDSESTIVPTSISYWFFRLTSCTEIVGFDHVDTSGVTNMKATFQNCEALKSVDTASLESGEVQTMESMFFGCKGLEQLDLSCFNTVNVSNMTHMFYDCTSLKTIYASDKFVTSNLPSEQDMFNNCGQLQGDKGTYYTTQEMGVRDKSPYAKLDGGAESPGYFSSGVGLHLFYGVSSENTLYLSDCRTINTPKINDQALASDDPSKCGWNSNRESITNIIIDEESSIKPTSMAYWFKSMKALSNIENLNAIKSEGLVDLSHLFEDCQKLTTLDLDVFDTTNVANMNSMFSSCSILKSINLFDFETKNVKNMEAMFKGCASLAKLNLSTFDTSSVTNMKEMFLGCTGLVRLDLSTFNTSATEFMDSMFSGCSKLEKVIITNFNTSKVTGMTYMFSGCSLLQRIYASESFVTTALSPTSQEMFNGCEKLEGDNGTKYSEQQESTRDTSIFACMDKEGTPGYFSAYTGHLYYGVSEDGILYISDHESSETTVPNDEALSSKATSDCKWLASATNIQKVVIDGNSILKPESIDYWFSGLTKCVEISGLNILDTSKTVSMQHTFENCSLLNSIDISNLDTSSVESMEKMFSQCASLVDLDVSKFNTSMVTNMKCMFEGCKLIDSLDVSNFNTEKVTKMSSMFEGCESLSKLDVSKFDTQSVQEISSMFCGCETLDKLDVTNFDTKQVGDMSRMFLGCSSITELDLSKFNTEQVTSMKNMFFGCLNLETVDVSSFNTANVVDLSGMFENCIELSTLDLSGFNTLNVTEMKSMFNECKALQTIFASSSFTTEKLSEEVEMFVNCSSLDGGNGTRHDERPEGERDLSRYARIDGGQSSPGYFAPPSGKHLYYGISSDNTLYLANQKTDLTPTPNDSALESKAASDCGWDQQRPNIKKVVIGSESIIKPTSMAYWFQRMFLCESIEGLNNIDTSDVTNMVALFASDEVLASIDLSNFKTSLVKDMSYMFSGCGKLTQLTFPSTFDTKSVENMSGMFNGCAMIEKLDLSMFNTSQVQNMSSVFQGCVALNDLNISSFNTESVTDMSGMFGECKALTSLDLSNFNTGIVTNMSGMFNFCVALNNLNVKSFYTGKVTDMSNMFSGCHVITKLDLSSFGTSQVKLMESMFGDCFDLQTITVSTEFRLDSLEHQPQAMFIQCFDLVGGADTKYSDQDPLSRDFSDFARIDNPPTAPGYFTAASANESEPVKKNQKTTNKDSIKDVKKEGPSDADVNSQDNKDSDDEADKHDKQNNESDDPNDKMIIVENEEEIDDSEE